MTATLLDRSADQVGDFLPSLGAALAILVVGLILVRYGSRLLTRVLVAAGGDRLAERLHVHDALARMGLERSLVRLIVGLARIVAAVAVVLVALSTLGLEAIDQAINEALLFLPRLLVAGALMLVGLGLAGVARERVDRLAYQMDLRGPIGGTAATAVIAVFAILALAQVGVPTTILVVLAGLVVAGAALTIALAFGLGNQDLARELGAARYAGAALAVGDDVTIGGRRGEVLDLQPSFVVLTTPEGSRLVIPNSQVMAGAVEVHPRD